jgi:chromosome segregation ATPase
VSKLEESIEKVDSKCDRIETNVAIISSKLEDQGKTLKENTDSLKDHILRTNTLQEMVISINKRLEPIEQERLKREAVSEFIKGKATKVAKVAGIMAAIITIAYYILKIKSGT